MLKNLSFGLNGNYRLREYLPHNQQRPNIFTQKAMVVGKVKLLICELFFFVKLREETILQNLVSRVQLKQLVVEILPLYMA